MGKNEGVVDDWAVFRGLDAAVGSSGSFFLSFFFPLTEMQTLFFHVVGRGGVGEHEVFRYLWLSYVAGGGHEA